MPSRELAEQVAAWENNTTPDDITSRQYQSVYNSFYQTHFPRLEEAGLIEYDRSEAMVHATDRLDELDPFFRSGTVWDGHWEDLVKAVLVGGVLFVGVGGLVFLPASIPSVGIAGLVAAVVLLTTVEVVWG